MAGRLIGTNVSRSPSFRIRAKFYQRARDGQLKRDLRSNERVARGTGPHIGDSDRGSFNDNRGQPGLAALRPAGFHWAGPGGARQCWETC